MATKIKRDLSGPERWSLIDQTTTQSKSKSQGKSPGPVTWPPHDWSQWTQKQRDSYVTAVTGIGPQQGKNQDRRAGRDRGRLIKGHF